MFAAEGGLEVVSPEPSQVSPHPSGNGDVVVNVIGGLRFILTPLPYGTDGYLVTRIGPVNVPPGAYVVIRDQAVVASVPPILPVEKIYLMANLTRVSSDSSVELLASSSSESEGKEDLAGLYMPALAASFGPSVAHRSAEAIAPNTTPFMLDGPAFPLTLPRFDPYGCEPYQRNPNPGNGAPHLVLLHRGQCSFALKSHHAAMAGARGVILVSHPSATDGPTAQDSDGFVVPGADPSEEDEDTMRALVPLVLVANTTGQALEDLVRQAAATRDDNSNSAHRHHDAQEVLQRVPPASADSAAAGARVMVRILPDRETDEPDSEDGEAEEHADGLVLGGYAVRNVKLHRIRDLPPKKAP